jgi:hypothetical protein
VALKSPVAFHECWGQVADATELPNISGATIQDAALQVGDIVWVADEDAMYQCTTATVGSAVWYRMIEDPNAIHDDVAGEINALTVKGTPTVSDVVLLEDVADSNAKAKSTIQNLPTALDAAAIHDDTAAEISAIASEKTAIVGADMALIEDSEASYGKKYIEVVDRPIVAEMSNLWQRPATPHSEDDEFDGSSLDAAWGAYNYATAAYESLVTGLDAYDGTYSGDDIRYALNPTTRKSWLLMQGASTITLLMDKTITFSTNLLIMARLKFHQYYSAMDQLDRILGLGIYADSTGLPSSTDYVVMYLNHSALTDTVYARFYERDGGAAGTDNVSTNVQNQGQALEYVAIHKIGTTYHGWVGTAAGNWIYMGSASVSATMSHVGIVFRMDTTTLPGLGVCGVDFIRFLETDNFLF